MNAKIIPKSAAIVSTGENIYITSLNFLKAVKLASLLAQYLNDHSRLDLPGIGSFLIAQRPANEYDPRSGKESLSGFVSFESNQTLKDNPELISFISSKTGKIKALAAADLDSHLGLAKQFLNIGKPFLFEGIGSLVKIKSGQYELAPGIDTGEKAKDFSSSSISDDTYSGYSNILRPHKEKMSWRRPAVILLIFGGIGLALWGGYTVYKITTAKNKNNKSTEIKNNVPSAIDTPVISKGSTTATLINSVVSAGQYKFVVESADKTRGLKRFATLKGYGLDIKMETADSSVFKLFFILKALPADTARMIDSLRGIYTPVGNKAYVEN